MRPLGIELTNFRSYWQETIDLAALRVALINGKNGNGKSTLIDAITFPLFGKGSDKDCSLDDYVRLGQTDMTNTLTFELDGVVYRVIRSRGKGSKSGLELQQQVGGEWLSKSGPTMPETQEAIKKLLRMDYDGFIASAFVVQGEADKFSKQKPSERKATLANILGLDAYSELESKAKERAKAVDIDIQVVKRQVEEIQARTAGKAGMETQLQDLEMEIFNTESLISQKEAELQALVEKRATLQASELRIRDIDGQIASLEREIRSLNGQLPELQNRAENARKIVANKDVILDKAKEAETVRQQVEQMDQVAAKHTELQLERGKLQNQLTQLNGEVTQARANLEGSIRQLQSQLEAARKQAKPLEGLQCDNPTCQLIRGAVEAKYRIPGLETEVKSAQEFLASERYKDRFAEAEERLNSELATHEVASANLQYDSTSHRDLKTRLVDLQKYEALIPRLETAQVAIDQAEQRIAEITAGVTDKQNTIGTLQIDRLALQGDADEAKELSVEISGNEAQLRIYRDQLGGLQAKQGAVKKSLDEIAELEVKQTGLTANLEALAADHRDWTDIAKACGKNGIQAMIIENAIPEIERESDNLLARMSGGRFSITLETQKASKTAKVAETLDIKISDLELNGVRVYETFSGAEKMMVDLSIRIALSKLLTRRAGATIRTLVLDETSSALDAANRAKFLEIIGTLKDDFDLVLVISHQEDIQDAFQQRIDVYRTDEGSKAQVVA